MAAVHWVALTEGVWMALSFVALDFETANGSRDSPCAVGICRVEDGRVVRTRVELCRPPVGDDRDRPLDDFFADFCVRIHGITAEAVRSRPRFEDLWPTLFAEELHGQVIVAHNAPFDLGVLRHAIARSFLTDGDMEFATWPTLDYLCTLALARRTLRLQTYRLPDVARATGVELLSHHDAGADARAAAEILLAIADARGHTELASLADEAGVAFGTLRPRRSQGPAEPVSARRSRAAVALPPPAADGADASHPLHGQTIVFTGTLAALRRQEAWASAAAVGARCAMVVDAETTMLVVGGSAGAAVSLNEQRARKLRSAGLPIAIVSEVDFIAMTGSGQSPSD